MTFNLNKKLKYVLQLLETPKVKYMLITWEKSKILSFSDFCSKLHPPFKVTPVYGTSMVLAKCHSDQLNNCRNTCKQQFPLIGTPYVQLCHSLSYTKRIGTR